MVESIQELRMKCQSVHADDFSAQIVRAVSIYFTRILIPFRVSANAVSIANVGVGILSGLAFAVGDLWSIIAGLLLFTLNSILDGVDGELARYWRKSSLTGLYMDRMNSIFLYPTLFGGIAIGLWKNDPGLPILIAAIVAVWASTAIRLVKTTVDTTIVDALTLSKAKQEQETPGRKSIYVPMSELLRSKNRWYLSLADFVTIRQPGFNIALGIAVAFEVAARAVTAGPAASPLFLYLLAYAFIFTVAVFYGLYIATKGGRIESTVQMLRDRANEPPVSAYRGE